MTALNLVKKTSCIVNLGLIAWLAAMVTGAFYKSLEYSCVRFSANDESRTVVHNILPSHQTHPFSYYHAIIVRDLFKTRHAQKVESWDPDDTEQLETAQLDVRLSGTVSGNDSTRFAVIEAKDGTNRRQQHLFREGETIELATIEKILRDKVVINLAGQRQMLLLEEYRSQAKRRPVPSYAGSGGRTYRRIIRRSTIERSVRNVGQLMAQAKIVPGKDGLVITAIKPGSVFRRLGLRNGDVIEGVNGRNVQSVEASFL